MKPSRQTVLQILDTIDILSRSWRRADIHGILSLVDEDCHGFGPGGEDRFTSRKELQGILEREFSRPEPNIFEFGDITVEAVGTVAWVFAEYHSTAIGSGEPGRGRFTAVLKGTGHAWIFAQLHISFPVRVI